MKPIKIDELKNFLVYLILAAFFGCALAPLFGGFSPHWGWCMAMAWSITLVIAVCQKAIDSYMSYRPIYINELIAAIFGASVGCMSALLTLLF